LSLTQQPVLEQQPLSWRLQLLALQRQLLL
jgi:hypothetical protein